MNAIFPLFGCHQLTLGSELPLAAEKLGRKHRVATSCRQKKKESTGKEQIVKILFNRCGNWKFTLKTGLPDRLLRDEIENSGLRLFWFCGIFGRHAQQLGLEFVQFTLFHFEVVQFILQSCLGVGITIRVGLGLDGVLIQLQ
jgi:hypothetical protein